MRRTRFQIVDPELRPRGPYLPSTIAGRIKQECFVHCAEHGLPIDDDGCAACADGSAD